MTNPRRAEYPYGHVQSAKHEGPQIPVTVVFSPEPTIHCAYDGIIDTGADTTFIPERFIELVKDLGCTPQPIDQAVSYANGKTEKRQRYTLDLMLGPWRVEKQPVVTLPCRYVIVGRDLLNRYHMTLDGRARTLTILDVAFDEQA